MEVQSTIYYASLRALRCQEYQVAAHVSVSIGLVVDILTLLLASLSEANMYKAVKSKASY